MRQGETIEGQIDPIRLAHEARLKKIEAARDKHKGKRVSQMTKQEQDELLEAIAQSLGLADENGIIK